MYNSFKFPARWQKLLGSARSGCTTLSYRNCVITPGWRLMRARYRTCFHALYDEKNVFIHHHHHHHIVPLAQIFLTLSRRFSLSFIASSRSSGLHPVSSHGCWMYVRAGRPAFARPYVGVHRSTSLMSSSLLIQQCPACLVHLTWIVFVMGGRWLYS